MNATNDHRSQGQFLSDEPLFKAALHHTAPMLVNSDLIAVVHASIKDKLSVDSKRFRSSLIRLFRSVRRFERQEEGLNHMVAISVG